SWAERQRTVKNNGKLSGDREKRLIDIGFVFNFKKAKEKAWQEKYLQLIEFKKEYGHCFVPVNWKANKSLGCWIATQRGQEEKGKLDAEKKAILDRLGFVWRGETKDKLDDIYQNQWQENYRKLQAYNKKWGTCQVSLKIDPALQRWTSLQRRLFTLDKLSPIRISKLDKLGFPWDINEAYWIKMYGALLRFHYSFGHTQVPWDKNPQLAAWVNRLKTNRHTLDGHKIKLLDAIGFDWEIKERVIVRWEEMYGRLIEFNMKHGHTRVPVQWEEYPKLGKWASRMRYEKMNLSWERIDLLDRINFDWGDKSIVVQQYRKTA
ncbi:MAG: helicase associated domain-containing protein, partial [Bacteroidota bacterium]|nr:helicase associated domain-containing protein [Bacteroidota bacterium]